MSYQTNVGVFPAPQTIEADVYVAPVDTAPGLSGEWPEPWQKIPSGTDSIEVTFKPKFDVAEYCENLRKAKLNQLRESMAAVARELRVRGTQAYPFQEEVKRLHRVPQDTETWNRFKVDQVLYKKNEQGHYKVDAVKFEDGSVYLPDGSSYTGQ